MDVVRITELQPKTYVEQGDYIAIDNQSDGTKKVQFTNLLDDTLSQENKIAPANVVGTQINTLESNLDAEISARTQQDSVLSARMDTFTQLPSGSTSGDAELIDIRVGADSITYPTAGDAVRGQVTDLKNDTSASVLYSGMTLENGAIQTNNYKTYDQLKTSSTTRVRFVEAMPINKNSTYRIDLVDTTYKFNIIKFDEGGLSYGYSDWISPPYTLTGASYIGIAVRNASNTTIAVSDVQGKIKITEVNAIETLYGKTNDLSIKSLDLSNFEAEYDRKIGGRNIASNAKIITVGTGNRLDSSGDILADVGYSFTDYLEVSPSETYLLNWSASVYACICEYDANKTFIQKTDSGKTLTTSATTKYIRYCGLTTAIANYAITYPVVFDTNVVGDKVDEIYLGNLFDGTTYTSGYYNNSGTITASDTYKHMQVSVVEGDILRWKYEDADLNNQNGVFFKDSTFVRAFRYLQTNVDNEYYEIIVPADVNIAYVNFRSASSFVIVKNSAYLATAKYDKVYMPKLDVSENISDAGVSLKDDVSYAHIFRKVCCIGDSITHGYYGDAGGVNYGSYLDYCYPSFLAKMIDADVVNMGLSGYTAKQWYESYSTAFSSDLTDWTKYDAFIIFLGTNGGISGDCNTDEDNTSQMGYYCRIIEMILAANSEASIFLCTSPWTQNRDAIPNFTSQILLCGQTYSLPVLRLDESKLLTYDNRLVNQPYDHVLHFGRVGLMRMASEVVRCINECGETNPSYFNKLYGTKS